MQEQVIYYQKRAKEYEQVYQKPERQTDLLAIKEYLSTQFLNNSVLEIACGTGYWTAILANPATSILATDINSEVLEIAQSKTYPKENVVFQQQSIEDLTSVTNEFEGFFGGFIWSHLRKEDLCSFLQMAVNQVKKGAEVLFLDNKYVTGSSTPISRKDEAGNTFQTRTLNSGEQFEVLKNFPDAEELKLLVEEIGTDFEWIDFQYYWMVKFRKK